MANIKQIRLSGTTYDIVDASAIHSLDGYSTTQQMNAAITAATNALAESIAEQGYQTSGDVQNAISGKADTSAVTAVESSLTAHTADTTIHVTSADKTAWNAKLDASDVTGFFGAVNYDSQSKRINFYNTSTGGTVLAYVDATDFIKDGMVDTVVVDEPTGGTYSGQTCLIITFNTDAGKEEIDIPISDIFNADNYYTKEEADATFLRQDYQYSWITNDIESLIYSAPYAQFAPIDSNGDYVGDGSALEMIDAAKFELMLQYLADGTLEYNGGGEIEIDLDNSTLTLTVNDSELGTMTGTAQVAEDVQTGDLYVLVDDPDDIMEIQLWNRYYSTKGDISDLQSQIDTKEEVIATALNDLDSTKQDELVSGQNIKTINNESLLGSGNITLQAQITIDDALSTSSENPVQNKVVTNAINAKNQVITISGEELIIS